MTDTAELRRIEPAELHAPGVAVIAHTHHTTDEPFLGVQIVWHPGIPHYMRSIALEAVIRHWQRNVGSVKRGGSNPAWDYQVLPGWRIMLPGQGRVSRLELAWREGEDA